MLSYSFTLGMASRSTDWTSIASLKHMTSKIRVSVTPLFVILRREVTHITHSILRRPSSPLHHVLTHNKKHRGNRCNLTYTKPRTNTISFSFHIAFYLLLFHTPLPVTHRRRYPVVLFLFANSQFITCFFSLVQRVSWFCFVFYELPIRTCKTYFECQEQELLVSSFGYIIGFAQNLFGNLNQLTVFKCLLIKILFYFLSCLLSDSLKISWKNFAILTKLSLGLNFAFLCKF